MEIEKNYVLQIESFEENYLINNNISSTFSFKVHRINYNLKNNNYKIEIKNKNIKNPFLRHYFIPFKFLSFLKDPEILPLKLNFYKQKVTFASRKSEKKVDFVHTTILEVNIGDEKINFYLCFPSLSDLKKIKKMIGFFLEKKMKLINEIPKNLPLVFGDGSAGVLFHEIVSHPLEGDIFKDSFYKNKIGLKLSKDFLTILDDPKYKGLPSGRSFDDEGEECTEKILIENGVLKNVLCNNILSRTLLFSPGNGRMTLENPVPLPRSWNTIVKGVKGNKKPLKEIYSNFIFIPFIKKASFSPPDKIFILTGPAFYYLNRKIYGKINYLIIEGFINEFLSGVDYIGEKVENSLGFGTCTKDGGKLFVGAASPEVSFLNISYKI